MFAPCSDISLYANNHSDIATFIIRILQPKTPTTTNIPHDKDSKSLEPNS